MRGVPWCAGLGTLAALAAVAPVAVDCGEAAAGVCAAFYTELHRLCLDDPAQLVGYRQIVCALNEGCCS